MLGREFIDDSHTAINLVVSIREWPGAAFTTEGSVEST